MNHPVEKSEIDLAGGSDGCAHLVAIGASAGGLEALSLLLSHLLPGLGCAYIIAQHLSPDYRSMLVEILARDTALPVREAEHEAVPAADTIYVVPPRANAVVEGGRFKLSPTTREISPKPSINLLFKSLAEEYGERAVGVILSGTGSDGTAGLQAIKAAGGMTIAQKPDTAKYVSMPQAAIDAGIVDRILAPEQIGAELERLIRLPDALPDLPAEDAVPPTEVAGLLELVRQHTSIDFSSYKPTTVLRRIRRRVIATGGQSLSDYLAYVDAHPDELDELAKETLISVTSFFRDKPSFRVLQRYAKEIVERKQPGEEIRIWVAGCATGEEAYSMAILFADQLGDDLGKYRLQVFATDIDADALNVARRGFYTRASTGELEPQQVDRYFQQTDGGFQASKTLRDLVIFARQDMTVDPPFLRMDMISCRNVLIYFNAELQDKVLAMLHYALRKDGVLFLGKSENVSRQEELFTGIDRRARVFRKRHPARGEPLSRLVRGQLVGLDAGSRPREKSYEHVLLDAVANNYAPTVALVRIDFKILDSHGPLEKFIRFSAGAEDFNLAQLIVPELRSELATVLHHAHQRKVMVRSRKRRVPSLEGKVFRLAVYPLGVIRGDELFLVGFEPVETAMAESEKEPVAAPQEMVDELAVTREHLQTLIEEMATSNEEMQALNEEVQASNEELQATNEELETANEELQATNEELVSLNEELMVKSAEMAAVNADFESVYNTIDFPLLVLDAGLLAKRVNSAATRLYNLPPTVAGFPFGRLGLPGWLRQLEPKLLKVVDEQRKEVVVLNEDGRTYRAYLTPGVGLTGETQSVVLSVVDNTDLLAAQQELKESQERLMDIMQNSVSAIALKDAIGRYEFVNRLFEELFGMTADTVVGKTDLQLFPEDVASLFRAKDLETMGARAPLRSQEHVMLGTQKHWFDTVRLPIFDAAGSVRAVCTQITDVSQTHHAEEQLRLAAKVFDRAGEAIAITDAESRILTVNDSFTTITGYAGAEVIGHTPAILKSGRHSPEFYAAMWDALAKKGWWQGEIFNRRKNGDVYPEWLTINAVRDDQGRTVNYVAIFSDITAIKNSQRRIEYMATHDDLTGLPNRGLFLDRLKHDVAQAKRQKTTLALLFIDLDNFKNINDSLGHEAGDQLLKEAANRLRSCVRDCDTLARLGGDEFVAIVDGNIDVPDVTQVASRIIDYLSASFPIQNQHLYVSASIGISLFPSDGDDSTALLRCADTAMYRAKERGRNQYQFFADEMKVLVLQRMAMETGLRVALERDYLHIAYQPQVDTSTGHIIGAEALLRWRDPTLGEVSPAQFIPLAEKVGLIGALGEAVVDKVLSQIVAWRAEGLAPPRISINVSARELRDPDFGNRLLAKLATAALPASAIGIELTESALMEHVDTAVAVLTALHEAGVRVSIDDFGTGYSSLAYLKRLPISELKIDRMFVEGIAEDGDDRQIAVTIINMARGLGLDVVAEGVERGEQQAVLAEHGCHVTQGFLLHRPLVAGDFQALLG